MEYNYKEVESRQYICRHRETGEEEIVTVSNRNMLTVEKHLELLNENDEEFEYLEQV